MYTLGYAIKALINSKMPYSNAEREKCIANSQINFRFHLAPSIPLGMIIVLKGVLP
jgi:hypothetical protein